MVKQKFNLYEFPGKFVMLVKTIEEYNTLTKILDKNGRRYPKNIQHLMPCYIYFNECGYGDTLEYCKTHCYIVLEMSDFDWNETKE